MDDGIFRNGLVIFFLHLPPALLYFLFNSMIQLKDLHGGVGLFFIGFMTTGATVQKEFQFSVEIVNNKIIGCG